MTNEEILKKAMLKVGMDPKSFDWERMLDNHGYFDIIFSHDFAKAFWGEKDAWVYSPFGDEVKERVEDLHNTYPAFVGPSWQFHLQRMVLEPEPLQYLAKFLPDTP